MATYTMKTLNIYTKIFKLIPFVSVVSLSIFFVFQINQVTQASYLVLEHERQIQGLSQSKENLETNFVQNSSLQDIETLAQELNFEKQGKIHYIKVLEGAVAAK